MQLEVGYSTNIEIVVPIPKYRYGLDLLPYNEMRYNHLALYHYEAFDLADSLLGLEHGIYFGQKPVPMRHLHIGSMLGLHIECFPLCHCIRRYFRLLRLDIHHSHRSRDSCLVRDRFYMDECSVESLIHCYTDIPIRHHLDLGQ